MSDNDLIRRGDALATMGELWITADNDREEGYDDGIAACLETIRALPARGVGVKPLQWNDAAFLEQYAKSVAGTYRVFEKDGLWRATVHTVDDAHFIAETEYLHDAQVAAQADYEARILAALEPAPTDAAQAREAALRAELDKWMERCGRERAFASSHRISAETAEAEVERLREALINLPAVYAHQINTGVREVYDPLQRFYTMESVLTALKGANHD